MNSQSNQTVSNLTDVLNAVTETWCFLRSRQSVLAYDTSSGRDLDLWVAEDSFSAVASRLCKVGYSPFFSDLNANGVRISQGASRTLFLYCGNNSMPSPLDLQCGDLYYGPIRYCSERQILANIEETGGSQFLSGYAYCLVETARSVLRNREISKIRQSQVRNTWTSLSNEEKESFYQESSNLLGKHFARSVSKYLSTGETLSRKVELFILSLRNYRSILQLRPLQLAKYLRNIRAKHRNAFTVCLMGTDGTGKTTQCNLLLDSLTRNGFLPVSSYFGRARGNTRVIKKLRDLVLRRKSGEEKKQFAGNTDHSNSVYSLGSIVYFIEYIVRYFLIWHNFLRKGKLVLFDRYPNDLLLMHSSNRKILKVLLKAFPKPKAIIFFDGDPEIIQKRKNERPIETVIHFQEQYGQHLDSLFRKCPVLRVDISDSIMLNQTKIAQSIITEYGIRNLGLSRGFRSVAE